MKRTSRITYEPDSWAALFEKFLTDAPEDTDETLTTQEHLTGFLEESMRERASDLHLDAGADGYRVRMRIDGAIVDVLRVSRYQGQRLIRAIKTQAGLESGYMNLPGDGQCVFRLEGKDITLRVATAPSYFGEKLAVRFLPSVSGNLHLHEIGLSQPDHEALQTALGNPSGMILVTGPTGSGKSTTVYALLHELLKRKVSIVTLEDPVEYALDGATQIQVNQRQGLTFAAGIAGVLRLDPDVVMMGEIRDEKSAHAAMIAADSGHLFLSTLHARDAAGTITALRNYGLSDHEIAANLSVVVAQRLVRRLCSNCARRGAATPEDKQWLRFYQCPVPKQSWQPVGCPKCAGTGFRGRTGVFEVWRLGEKDIHKLLTNADEPALRKFLRLEGTHSMLDDDLSKLAEGVTALSELRAIGGMDFYAARDGRAGLPDGGQGEESEK